MFKVNIDICVWDTDQNRSEKRYAILYRKGVELPFPPFIDLELRFPLEQDQRLKSVTWNVDDQLFMCQVKDIFIDGFGVDSPTFDEFIESLESTGWSSAGINVYKM